MRSGGSLKQQLKRARPLAEPPRLREAASLDRKCLGGESWGQAGSMDSLRKLEPASRAPGFQVFPRSLLKYTSRPPDRMPRKMRSVCSGSTRIAWMALPARPVVAGHQGVLGMIAHHPLGDDGAQIGEHQPPAPAPVMSQAIRAVLGSCGMTRAAATSSPFTAWPLCARATAPPSDGCSFRGNWRSSPPQL